MKFCESYKHEQQKPVREPQKAPDGLHKSKGNKSIKTKFIFMKNKTFEFSQNWENDGMLVWKNAKTLNLRRFTATSSTIMRVSSPLTGTWTQSA